jgi:acyl-coenzyme A thioesterase PaaI-like protein
VQTAETVFRDRSTGNIVALGLQVFACTPDPRAHVENNPSSLRTTGSLTKPFPEAMGIRVSAPGSVEMDRGEGRGNAMGGLQGGLVVLLGEMAAESLPGHEVTELEINYLRSVDVGPGQAVAQEIGPGLVRIEVRDPGRDNRLCAIMLATAAPPA